MSFLRQPQGNGTTFVKFHNAPKLICKIFVFLKIKEKSNFTKIARTLF